MVGDWERDIEGGGATEVGMGVGGGSEERFDAISLPSRVTRGFKDGRDGDTARFSGTACLALSVATHTK